MSKQVGRNDPATRNPFRTRVYVRQLVADPGGNREQRRVAKRLAERAKRQGRTA